jgi:2,4-dienoyl-CoA reductase-like NADH-dependent reductase (Old Yellow Enzyme family)
MLAAIRNRVGESFPVWFRIPGDEFVNGGLDVEEAATVASRLEAVGSDAFHVTVDHSWDLQHVAVTGVKKQYTYSLSGSKSIKSSEILSRRTVG